MSPDDPAATDSKQGTGLGSALLLDALLRTLAVAEAVGIRAVLLHAMSDEAKRFYLHHGFAESPVDPMTMMVLLADVERPFARKRRPLPMTTSVVPAPVRQQIDQWASRWLPSTRR